MGAPKPDLTSNLLTEHWKPEDFVIAETPVAPSTTRIQSALAGEMEKITGCIHCGLCLPVCPTYNQVGNENDSPRGRIYLMRAVAEGRLELESPTLSRHIDLCLGCRACETACPAGVRYGHLLESTREAITESETASGRSGKSDLQKRLLGLSLRHLFPRPRLLAAALTLVRLFRDSGLPGLLLGSGLLRRLAVKADFALSLLTSTIPLRLGSQPVPGKAGEEVDPTALAGISGDNKRRAPVAIFTGCVMEGLFTATNRATSRVLSVNGHPSVGVPTQVCCGALHAHSGDLTTARQLARQNIDAFEPFLQAPHDAAHPPTVVINAAGCGALLKEYGELLADDPAYAERAHRFSRHVQDVAELLARHEIRTGAPLNERVTFDAPCHLYHAQRVQSAPQRVLASIPGLEYRQLEGMADCCGGAGIYNLSEPEMSGGILAEKMERVRATDARILATANPGCQMQLGAGARLHNVDCQVTHVVDLLDESYRRAGYYR